MNSETEQLILLNRYCPTTEWSNPSNFFPIYDDWEDEMEDGDDLECGIGMPAEDNEEDKVGKTNTLSELFGVENKRVPEDDNFDLGLGLESPDIQRWADETGWSEITSKIEELDYGWDEALSTLRLSLSPSAIDGAGGIQSQKHLCEVYTR